MEDGNQKNWFKFLLIMPESVLKILEIGWKTGVIFYPLIAINLHNIPLKNYNTWFLILIHNLENDFTNLLKLFTGKVVDNSKWAMGRCLTRIWIWHICSRCATPWHWGLSVWTCTNQSTRWSLAYVQWGISSSATRYQSNNICKGNQRLFCTKDNI